MSEGTDSTQTKTGKENLTLRARVCTKPLPCWRVWEKEKYCRELAKDITSLIKWPTKGWWKHWFLIARIEVSESPSKIELPKLISWRKVTALRSTIVSKTTIDDGRGMISDNAARTSPEEFQTTTPIPTTSKSSKIAPSKLVFRGLRSGGFQIVCFGGCLMTDLPRSCWNSWRYCCARSESLSSGITASLTPLLFRRVHKNQQIVMNSSAPREFCNANLKRSTKDNYGELSPNQAEIFTTLQSMKNSFGLFAAAGTGGW